MRLMSVDVKNQDKPNIGQQVFLDWTLDILIYVVVINTFVQLVGDFYISSFTLSLFVAVLMKILLTLIIRFEHSAVGYFEHHSNEKLHKLSVPVALVILFLSKFLIIEIIDFVFGDKVDFHNFIALILMLITMIATRKILEVLYDKLD